MLPGPLLFSPGQWRPGFPLSGMSWAGWYGPDPQTGMGSRIGVQGPGGERGLGVGENTAPCQIWAQAWLQTLAGRGRQGQREKLTWSPAVRWGGMGQSLLLCRGKGRLAVCPALSEGQEGTSAL